MESQRQGIAQRANKEVDADVNANGTKPPAKRSSPDSPKVSTKLAVSAPDDIPLTRGNISFLQRAIGNGATWQFIQRRLKVGRPNDSHEREADDMAEQITQMREPSASQAFIPRRQTSNDEESLSAKEDPGEYAPESTEGKKLLAHELTHVAQQQVEVNRPQRAPLSIQRQPPSSSNLDQLNEMLNRFDVPEGDVINLCKALTADEKTTVLAGGYKERVASALDVGEMVQAVDALGPALSTKLDWVKAATFITRGIDYSDISGMVRSAPQTERAALKTDTWKGFFVDVCTNDTMVTALNDLGFDLVTKLTWLRAEMTVTSWELDYSTIKAWITAAPQAERDALKTDDWKGFFVAVCSTNETMVTALNDLNFDLVTKLTWLRAEMTVTRWELDYPTIKAWITAAPQAERDALKTDDWKGFFVAVCSTNETMVTALNDLNFDLVTKLTWLRAEMTVTSWELDYPTIQPWIIAAPQTERDALKTDAWKEFFVAVCTKVTMEEAVGDLNHDLEIQIRWMIAESDEATVLATTSFITKLRAAPNFAYLMKILGVNDVFVYDLRLKLKASNKTGFFDDVSGLAGARAGDTVVHDAFKDFVNDGHITWAEAFRAATLLELGPRRGWPALIQNYDDGLAAGTFTIAALPPVGAEALRQFCMVQAGEAAEGTGVMSSYRNQFNSLWDAPPHNALPADFDPTLDSKGPRNKRARSIFTVLYASAAIKTAYDSNTPAGFREMCDTLAGPEGINLIASPRVQNLRALLNPPVVTASVPPIRHMSPWWASFVR